MSGDMQQIWADVDAASGGDAMRGIGFSGKTGRYTFGKDDEDGKKRFQAILLYVTPDHGRALWPDGKVFTGDKALCQSERITPPYDVPFRSANGSDLAAMHRMGWTGRCSTCQVPSDVCKPQRIAYLLDLHHMQSGGEPCVSKLFAKGPQSTWNFKACLGKLMGMARKEGKEPTAYVLEFSSESGSQNSHKVAFSVVGVASEEQRAIANTLAVEAYHAANKRRTAAPALPASQPVAALPAERVDVVEVVDAEELF